MVKGWGSFMGGSKLKSQWGQEKWKKKKNYLRKKISDTRAKFFVLCLNCYEIVSFGLESSPMVKVEIEEDTTD